MAPGVALAQSQSPSPSSGPSAPATQAQPEHTIVVTARRLDEARASIQPSLGADSYAVSQDAIKALPGGANQQFNQILLQIPGVSQDGGGQFHVRDDHANLQYRINGTILPEGLAVFGQTLSPRLIDHFALLTGALPAQYGLRTAGIMDITTKSGLFAKGGQVSLYGGSHGSINPSFDYGGSSGDTNYFVSGDFKHNNLGIESVDGSSTPLHDKTDQAQGFAYVDHIVDPDNRISFLGGFANQHFQIPNPRGLSAAQTGPGYSVGGQSDYLSDNLNEQQLERTGFGQLAWLRHTGALTLQTSVSARYSELIYRPDVTGELLFNGTAQNAYKNDLALSGQMDGVWRVSHAHTIRFGFYVQHDHAISRTGTYAFPLDDSGAQTGQPIDILDDSASNAWTTSAYLQDEWKLGEGVTLNYGGRFDRYAAYRTESQFSPRVNMVWEPAARTAIHLGYARYFSPPPFELVGGANLGKLAGTSAAAGNTLDTTPYAERQNYFDIGFEQKIKGGFSLGVDAYYRLSTNLIDEGQFGAPIIQTPFNYAKGRIRGVEFNASYNHGPWSIYGNIAMAKAQGKGISSSQFNFSAQELAYIANHYIYLDHDQTYTGSAGVNYAFKQGGMKGLKLGTSLIYGSGLRTQGSAADGSVIPNGAHLPAYAQVNLSASYRIERPGVELRFDIINVGDHAYQIRDGAGVGVGAPQWGARRGFFVGVTKDI
ncbi:TonB-dependent receptor [Novosphingobium sp.]|uniref:TonB-dependent receptor n=1 Tax=Novosphingobium sp. TaxID=1874826 RepID=UPI0031D8DECB